MLIPECTLCLAQRKVVNSAEPINSGHIMVPIEVTCGKQIGSPQSHDNMGHSMKPVNHLSADHAGPAVCDR